MWNLEIAVLAAGINLFMNYCIGKPGSDKFSPYEIFSIYTVWLSEWRLKRMNLLDTYTKQYHENLQRQNTKAGRMTLMHDYKRMVYDAADPYFTWERMVGMCPVCTGFWVSLAVALCFTFNFVALVSISVVSHIIIRLLSKFI